MHGSRKEGAWAVMKKENAVADGVCGNGMYA